MALHEQRERFREKFGRDPGQNEPVFFDPDAKEPAPYPKGKMETELLQAMRKAGTPPQIIYAFKKTGRLLTAQSEAPPHARKEWDDAIDEYFALEDQTTSKS